MTNAPTTIRTATQALLDETISLSPTQDFRSFHKSFVNLKGIGDWTANYVGMRGLGMIDSFPANDLGILKAMKKDDKKTLPRQFSVKVKNGVPTEPMPHSAFGTA